MRSRAATLLLAVLIGPTVASADEPWHTTATVAAELHPYAGPSVAGVDWSTLSGKVLCGY